MKYGLSDVSRSDIVVRKEYFEKLLLETSGDSIQQIAEQCGFKKANSFSSQFKASTGLTPKEYRESRR